MGSQSRPGAGRGGAHGSWRSIRRTVEPLVAGGLAAHVSAAALTLFQVQPSLLIALVATLVFAGIGLVYARRIDGQVGPSSGRLVASLAADAVIIVIVGAGGWLIGWTLESGAAFYCDPRAPWRIEIAPAGGFGVAFVTDLARRRHRAWAVYPLVMLALAWIAPFYGFFSAPLYLGMSLSTMCPGRSVAGVALVALGIRVGERVGLAAARWIRGDI